MVGVYEFDLNGIFKMDKKHYYTDEKNAQIVIALLKAHGIRRIVANPGTTDTHQHHFSETPVFAGGGVRAVETNESNTYRRTQRKNTVFRSANQY